MVLAAFLAVPVPMFAGNVLASAGLRSLPSSARQLGSPTAFSYGQPTAVYAPGRAGPASDLCVTFEFLNVSPATSQASVGILVGVTRAGKTVLRGLAGRARDITLVVDSNSGVSPIELPVPITSLLTDPLASVCGRRDFNQPELLQQARLQSVQNVFVLEQPRAFPDDWYEVNAGVTVWAGQGAYRRQLPTSVLMMSRDQDYTVRVGLDQASPAGSAVHRLEFIVQRPTSLVIYTYFVSIMPLVLLLLLGWFCALRKEVPTPSEAAFGVAATLVAILPLRNVLIPPAITDLTRLDILFGLQAAVLVALSLILVGIWGPVLKAAVHQPAGTADASALSDT
ncbi:MAG: DUF4436 family protein [Streptosporangiaceae bacterium]